MGLNVQYGDIILPPGTSLSQSQQRSYQGLIDSKEKRACKLPPIKIKLKVVTLSTVNIGAEAANVTKYSNNYNHI